MSARQYNVVLIEVEYRVHCLDRLVSWHHSNLARSQQRESFARWPCGFGVVFPTHMRDDTYGALVLERTYAGVGP